MNNSHGKVICAISRKLGGNFGNIFMQKCLLTCVAATLTNTKRLVLLSAVRVHQILLAPRSTRRQRPRTGLFFPLTYARRTHN